MAIADPRERRSDTLVCTPTYNEGGSIGALLDGLLASSRPFDIVIVDDGSTDGTQDQILSRAKTHPQIGLISRKGKLGIGSAHQLGWLHARRLGYVRIVTLDADLSHDPADVPRLLDALDAGADVAIGSRFIEGGRLDYSGWRFAVSRTANIVARSLLAMPTYEQTTSLRAARLDKVPEGLVESMLHDGYAFFLSCMARFARAGLKIAELPIHFRDRNSGQSKLPPFEIVRCGVNLLQLAALRTNPAPIPLLPEDRCTCARCGRPYLIRTEAGGVRCLACLAEP
jgi:glycosyltransferase involved in cell wall biosynthesis